MGLSIIPMPQKMTFSGEKNEITAETEISYLTDNGIPSEGYRLAISNGSISITSSANAGRFYAEQTLKQIFASCGGDCENVVIEDFPRFSHRGFMIDCARHFFGTEDLKKIIDTAAYFKLNIFHWHLTDDQGWRLPVDSYPLLTEIGSKRKNSLFRRVDEGGEYSASFSKDDIIEIVRYCNERYIEIIPEIEMPGHTSSVLASYPNLGCTGEHVDVATKEGIFDTVLCLGNQDTMTFVKNVLDEVCELFPGKYIHIGGDEAPRTRWSSCPKCREKLISLGTDDFNVLQGNFIKEVALYLKSKGRTAITWNESLKGGVPGTDDLVIQRWMDKENLSKKFAQDGGKIIETDFYHCYCDYPYGMTPVKKTYYFDSASKIGLENAVLGTEAELWTEYIRDFDTLCEKLYPRMSAIAERAWSDKSIRDYKNFVCRHEVLRKSIENMGVKVIPVEKWSLTPPARLADILRFFNGSISIDNIKNILNNQK